MRVDQPAFSFQQARDFCPCNVCKEDRRIHDIYKNRNANKRPRLNWCVWFCAIFLHILVRGSVIVNAEHAMVAYSQRILRIRFLYNTC